MFVSISLQFLEYIYLESFIKGKKNSSDILEICGISGKVKRVLLLLDLL